MIRHLGPRADVAGVVADAGLEGREVHVVRAGATKQATLEAFAAELAEHIEDTELANSRHHEGAHHD